MYALGLMWVAQGVLLGSSLLADKEGDSGMQVNLGLPLQVQSWPGIQVNPGLDQQLQDCCVALDDPLLVVWLSVRWGRGQVNPLVHLNAWHPWHMGQGLP